MDDFGEQGVRIIKEGAEVSTYHHGDICLEVLVERVLEGWLSEKTESVWKASWIGDLGNRFCFGWRFGTQGKQNYSENRTSRHEPRAHKNASGKISGLSTTFYQFRLISDEGASRNRGNVVVHASSRPDQLAPHMWLLVSRPGCLMHFMQIEYLPYFRTAF